MLTITCQRSNERRRVFGTHVRSSSAKVAGDLVARQFIDAYPEAAAVLNGEDVVYANSQFAGLIGEPLERISLQFVDVEHGAREGTSYSLVIKGDGGDRVVDVKLHSSSVRYCGQEFTLLFLRALSGRQKSADSTIEAFGVQEFLGALCGRYRQHSLARGKRLALLEGGDELCVATDRTLLTHVVGDLIENALEAARAGDTVSVGAVAGRSSIVLSVHNPRCSTEDGRKRAIDTQSVKTLTETSLGGRVHFSTNAESGTLACVGLPVRQVMVPELLQ